MSEVETTVATEIAATPLEGPHEDLFYIFAGVQFLNMLILHSSSNSAIRYSFDPTLYGDETISLLNVGTRVAIPIFAMPIVIGTALTQYVPETWLFMDAIGFWTLFGICVVNPIASYWIDFVAFALYSSGNELQAYLDYPALWWIFGEKTTMLILNMAGTVYYFDQWRAHVAYHMELLSKSEDDVEEAVETSEPETVD